MPFRNLRISGHLSPVQVQILVSHVPFMEDSHLLIFCGCSIPHAGTHDEKSLLSSVQIINEFVWNEIMPDPAK